MDEIVRVPGAELRCGACTAVIELDDHVVTVAGRRFHRSCVHAPVDTRRGGPTRFLRGLRHWSSNRGLGEGRRGLGP